MVPMRFKAGDISSRVRMARLISRMEDAPEVGRQLGLEDVSRCSLEESGTDVDTQKERRILC